jgi:hypothetical protein
MNNMTGNHICLRKTSLVTVAKMQKNCIITYKAAKLYENALKISVVVTFQQHSFLYLFQGRLPLQY